MVWSLPLWRPWGQRGVSVRSACGGRPQLSVQDGARANRLLPLGDERVPPPGALGFGPAACSVANAAQELGAAGQQDAALSSSPRPPAEEQERRVTLEEERPSAAEILPPATIERRETRPETPPVPPPAPRGAPPPGSWGRGEDGPVQHQKQTSSQLLHFLRANAKHTGALEVGAPEVGAPEVGAPEVGALEVGAPEVGAVQRRRSSLPPEPRLQSQRCRLGREAVSAVAPVFRVKRVESSGALTYTCVIATNTELWDLGDVFTEAGRRRSGARPAGSEAGAPGRAQDASPLHLRPQSRQRTEPAGAAPRPRRAAVPEFHVRRFEEAAVVVSHVVSPGNFYIQHADAGAALRALFTG
ncbi:hypothetical protein EYF80_042089 [Liparis tanakae]|uniref:Uncharacterized protein n=1 Tax=Liparis tanakae TaxID=230148 RepID=A0A4Z2G550_9TELE|nr:hypothetical protein EYF80_042089 [Liparis tanakae]